MNIPVITGTGRWVDLDSDDYPRLVLLPEMFDEVDPRLWDLFVEPQTSRMSTSSPLSG